MELPPAGSRVRPVEADDEAEEESVDKPPPRPGLRLVDDPSNRRGIAGSLVRWHAVVYDLAALDGIIFRKISVSAAHKNNKQAWDHVLTMNLHHTGANRQDRDSQPYIPYLEP